MRMGSVKMAYAPGNLQRHNGQSANETRRDFMLANSPKHLDGHLPDLPSSALNLPKRAAPSVAGARGAGGSRTDASIHFVERSGEREKEEEVEDYHGGENCKGLNFKMKEEVNEVQKKIRVRGGTNNTRDGPWDETRRRRDFGVSKAVPRGIPWKEGANQNQAL
jgi:hypothetical protein